MTRRAAVVVAGLNRLPPPPGPWWRRAVWALDRHAAGWWGPVTAAAAAGVLGTMFLPRPAWMPDPPVFTWRFHVQAYGWAALAAFVAWDLWRAAATRFEVYALGVPRLVGGSLLSVKKTMIRGLPVLGSPPGGSSASAWWVLAPALLMPAGLGPVLIFAPISGRYKLMGGVVLAVAVAAAVGQAVAVAWRVPAGGGFWLTDEGVATRGLIVRWAEADRVALAPVPEAVRPGTVALEVAAGGRRWRSAVTADAVPALHALLAAVPADRLVRAGGDG